MTHPIYVRALRRLEREDGQTLVEYALIIMFVAIGLVVALGTLANGLDATIGDVADHIAGLVGS